MAAITAEPLTWNHARLLALVLNALTGLTAYFDSAAVDLDVDSLFTLRMAESELRALHRQFDGQSQIHKDVWTAIGSLANRSDQIVGRGVAAWTGGNPNLAKELSFLLNRRERPTLLPYATLDERWRWRSKDPAADTTRGRWLDESGSGIFAKCLRSLEGCELTAECSTEFLERRGGAADPLTQQVLFLRIAQTLNCAAAIDERLRKLPAEMPRDSAALATALCTNLFDETAALRKSRRRLARVDFVGLQRLMEQTFVCGSMGFPEFVDPHALETVLAWQHPRHGCFPFARPEPVHHNGVADHPLDSTAAAAAGDQSRRDDACDSHQSAVGMNALIVALRLLVQPPPWPEHRLHTQELLVQLHQIPAEDQFHAFKYIAWVRDSRLPSDIRLRPPPMAWSPDLIAFVVLAFIFVAGSVLAHYAFTRQNRGGVGPRPHSAKQFYMYAYKRL